MGLTQCVRLYGRSPWPPHCQIAQYNETSERSAQILKFHNLMSNVSLPLGPMIDNRMMWCSFSLL